MQKMSKVAPYYTQVGSKIGNLAKPAPQICTRLWPAPKQAMCKHMADGGGCKGGDAKGRTGAAKTQFLNQLVYKQESIYATDVS